MSQYSVPLHVRVDGKKENLRLFRDNSFYPPYNEGKESRLGYFEIGYFGISIILT